LGVNSLLTRVILTAVLLSCAPVARADGIEPGLWKITTWAQSGGIIGPPQQSEKCLTPAETSDLTTTFSPVSRTVNSECAPIERSLVGTKFNWKLVCKGQLDMNITGDFNFDGPHHYVASVHNTAAMAGMQMLDTRTMIEAEWMSECP
jgi:hypothetical protein